MPLSEYGVMDRIFGNLIVSLILSVCTVMFLYFLKFLGVSLDVTLPAYFIFPSYFILLTVFSETKVRRENKDGVKKTT